MVEWRGIPGTKMIEFTQKRCRLCGFTARVATCRGIISKTGLEILENHLDMCPGRKLK